MIRVPDTMTRPPGACPEMAASESTANFLASLPAGDWRVYHGAVNAVAIGGHPDLWVPVVLIGEQGASPSEMHQIALPLGPGAPGYLDGEHAVTVACRVFRSAIRRTPGSWISYIEGEITYDDNLGQR